MARIVPSLFLKVYFLLQDPASAPRQRSYPPTLLLSFKGIRDEVSQVLQQAQGLIREDISPNNCITCPPRPQGSASANPPSHKTVNSLKLKTPRPNLWFLPTTILSRIVYGHNNSFFRCYYGKSPPFQNGRCWFSPPQPH